MDNTEQAPESQPKKKKVSYSQYSMWFKCPNQWKLNYLDGLRKSDQNLNLSFGTAMHFAIQTYLEQYYVNGHTTLDANALFQTKFSEEIEKAKKEDPNFDESDKNEFINNGRDIFTFLLNPYNRNKYFPIGQYEFIGAEVPIDIEILHNTRFIAYIDLVLYDKAADKYKIYDFKTSTNGWNSYQKADESKYSQVLLYKAFFSNKMNVDMNKIDVEFFILKRKLYEDVAYPQSRIQTFSPIHNKPAISSAIDGFMTFIKECFNEDGSYNTTAKYLKIPGNAKKNCKYCAHFKTNCDAKADKIPD